MKKKLLEQKKILESVVGQTPKTDEQKKVIEEGKNLLKKVNKLLRVYDV